MQDEGFGVPVPPSYPVLQCYMMLQVYDGNDESYGCYWCLIYHIFEYEQDHYP